MSSKVASSNNSVPVSKLSNAQQQINNNLPQNPFFNVNVPQQQTSFPIQQVQNVFQQPVQISNANYAQFQQAPQNFPPQMQVQMPMQMQMQMPISINAPQQFSNQQVRGGMYGRRQMGG